MRTWKSWMLIGLCFVIGYGSARADEMSSGGTSADMPYTGEGTGTLTPTSTSEVEILPDWAAALPDWAVSTDEPGGDDPVATAETSEPSGGEKVSFIITYLKDGRIKVEYFSEDGQTSYTVIYPAGTVLGDDGKPVKPKDEGEGLDAVSPAETNTLATDPLEETKEYTLTEEPSSDQLLSSTIYTQKPGEEPRVAYRITYLPDGRLRVEYFNDDGSSYTVTYPAGTVLGPDGKPVDTDGDGVPDYKDAYPDHPFYWGPGDYSDPAAGDSSGEVKDYTTEYGDDKSSDYNKSEVKPIIP
jgi:hypothetical protein